MMSEFEVLWVVRGVIIAGAVVGLYALARVIDAMID